MKKESVIYAAGGLIVGAIITGAVAVTAVNNDNRNIMKMMGMDISRVQDNSAGHKGMSMNAMQQELQHQSGDDFDKNFIDMMIAHHDGAIAMAQLAKTKAKHNELKTMAGEIINAQSEEIHTMHDWQKEWGYHSHTSPHAQ